MSKLWLSSVIASVLSHVALSMMLEKAPVVAERRVPTTVMLDVIEPRSPPPAPPRPEPPPAPAAIPALPVARDQPPAPEPAPEPEPSAPAKVVDLTGVTLASDEGSFSVPQSSGEARSGPLDGMRRGERVGQRRATAPRVTAPARRPVAPPLVPLRDLSARPRPPGLNAALSANYPPGARAQGVGGSATVRVHISASGVAGAMRVTSQSFPGFGEACRRTVNGTHWTPPRAADGRAVATEIVYRCRFVVDP